MYIERINIKNFRLLEDVEISLEEITTVFVGRNNSGKTSFTELFRRLLTDNAPTFQLEDFSLKVHKRFWDAYESSLKGNDDKTLELLPSIEVLIVINYKNDISNLGSLSDFIIDLNPDCTDAYIKIRYQLDGGAIHKLFADLIFDKVSSVEVQQRSFFQLIKERIPKLYRTHLLVVDPNDLTNQKPLEWKKLQQLIQGNFIFAQRELGDVTTRERDVLGKIVEGLFSSAKSESANSSDRSIAENLKLAVQNIEKTINDDFNNQLNKLIPAISIFGYPRLSDPRLVTETILNVESLLKEHTKVRYSGVNGINLPETYNGLGTRNLIYILLKIFEFYKSYITKAPNPVAHIIFIEEPESHLHPQMQEVFISQINKLVEIFPKIFNNGESWQVQFVVTTHSSHVANKAEFTTIRYFMSSIDKSSGFYYTKIKDLKFWKQNSLLSQEPQESQKSQESKDITFLQQYMTLTRCNLFFADMAILIEGTAERLLLPKMIEKLDTLFPDLQLGSQYLSVVEVGGAYAHRFFKLIEFLEIKTLIITDLDSINSNDGNKTCIVSKGDRTSNACIKTLFGDNITPQNLILKTEEEKIRGFYRIAYQIPEHPGGACGRSFEEAFILANQQLFHFNVSSEEEKEELAWVEARKVKKVEFALKYALEVLDWNIPRYIMEGLLWLGSTFELTSLEKYAEAAAGLEEFHDSGV